MNQDDYGQRMAELRTRFLARADRDRQALGEAIANGQWAEARRLAHGLAGIAGTFGFADVGDAAYALEDSIDSGGDEARSASWQKLESLLFEAAMQP